MKKLQFVLTSILGLFLMSGFTNALSIEAVMPIVNGWSAAEASNGVKVVRDGDNYYVCNGGSLSNCKKNNASAWVKKSGSTRYICSSSSTNCDSITNNGEIRQGTNAQYGFNGYYMCDPNSGVCDFSDNNTKINKISGGANVDNAYYVCQGSQYKCGKDNASYKVNITASGIYKCSPKIDYCSQTNASSSIKEGNISSSNSSSSNNYQNLINNMTANEYYKKFVEEAVAGSQYRLNDDYENAIIHDKNAVYIAEQGSQYSSDLKKELPDIYSKLASDLCYNGEFNESETYFQKALKLSSDSKITQRYETCKKLIKYNSTTSTTSTSSSSFDYNKSCANTYGNGSIADPEDPENYCICKEGYERNKDKTSCIKFDYEQNCINHYGKHSIPNPNDYYNSCVCEDGYRWNRDKTACLKMGTTNSTETETTSNTTSNNGYPQEYKDAYAFAYQNKITTMPTIEEAKMNDEIIRAEIAKMLANWVKSLGRTPDTSKSCSFKDISGVKGDLYTAVIESCQLGIMGQGINEFRPFDKITKGEVSTAVSRIIWGSKYNGGEPFYLKHMDALKDIGVLKDVYNPNTNELRGNVMVMLMKASGTNELADCEDPAVLLACSLGEPSCPAKCDEETKTEVEDEVDIDALVDNILKEAKAYDDYSNSINIKIQEVNKIYNNRNNQESKSPEELATEENLEEIKKIINADESIKSELQKIGGWKGDNALINIAIEYTELHLLMFTNFYDLNECLILSQKYIDNGENYKINEIDDKMKSALEGARTADGQIEGKYEEYKKVYNDLKKKYGTN